MTSWLLRRTWSMFFDITSPFDAARKLAPSVLVHSIARVPFEARSRGSGIVVFDFRVFADWSKSRHFQKAALFRKRRRFDWPTGVHTDHQLSTPTIQTPFVPGVPPVHPFSLYFRIDHHYLSFDEPYVESLQSCCTKKSSGS